MKAKAKTKKPDSTDMLLSLYMVLSIPLFPCLCLACPKFDADRRCHRRIPSATECNTVPVSSSVAVVLRALSGTRHATLPFHATLQRKYTEEVTLRHPSRYHAE